ncbi:hypothetical protein RSO01_86900 [Reyranella soli]|uniref:Uncharacterized protein n=1 Tax=Reyranella soli TaxID=1230389 RepID=A0A512NRF9_9HYPH|nr:hypothetical protein RSO01_86900 [Reyranella soli]
MVASHGRGQSNRSNWDCRWQNSVGEWGDDANVIATEIMSGASCASVALAKIIPRADGQSQLPGSYSDRSMDGDEIGKAILSLLHSGKPLADGRQPQSNPTHKLQSRVASSR